MRYPGSQTCWSPGMGHMTVRRREREGRGTQSLSHKTVQCSDVPWRRMTCMRIVTSTNCWQLRAGRALEARTVDGIDGFIPRPKLSDDGGSGTLEDNRHGTGGRITQRRHNKRYHRHGLILRRLRLAPRTPTWGLVMPAIQPAATQLGRQLLVLGHRHRWQQVAAATCDRLIPPSPRHSAHGERKPRQRNASGGVMRGHGRNCSPMTECHHRN